MGQLIDPKISEVVDLILSDYEDDRTVNTIDIHNQPDKTAIKAAVKEFHTAAAAAGKVVKAGDDDLEKILLLHDYLVTECTYDN